MFCFDEVSYDSWCGGGSVISRFLLGLLDASAIVNSGILFVVIVCDAIAIYL